MINRLKLIRNVGQFDSVNGAADLSHARVTVVYAENGRGKTTLSAVLRSLATGDPNPIAERRRLAAQHSPHVVLEYDGDPPLAVFKDNTWTQTIPNIAVFDDEFIDRNVYSGLVVTPDHRQNLHELILGAQGIALNQQLQELVAQVEAHNAALREKVAAIPIGERGTLSVDEFCSLPPRANVDEEIQEAERNLAAAIEQDTVRNTPPFDALRLPAFDLPALEQLLQQDLPAVDAAAVAAVQAHIADAGEGAETWIADGMRRLPEVGADHIPRTCPFCAQDLAGSPVIDHYRAYFSDAYRELKRTVADALSAINRIHGEDAPANFERAVRVALERQRFWSRFCEVPSVNLDTALIARDWRAAREAVAAALGAKQAAPLEGMELPDTVRTTVAAYDSHRQVVTLLSDQLQHANISIHLVKEQAASSNAGALASDVARLKAVKARHSPPTAALCDAYLAEKVAKLTTEQRRDQVKAALEQYRSTVFPGFQTAINVYLERFNAGFRLSQVTAVDTRGGPTCTYSVIINDTAVPVTRTEVPPGAPSFRTTLSAGDRNTLALAFFFASLDQDPDLANKIAVIDDPISSLDEHRSLTTVQEIRRLAQRVSQVILLSHSKTFLCRVWEGTDTTCRAALQVTRAGNGSTIVPWNVDQDCVSEHDRRHALLREYLNNGTGDLREIARSIRPLLEAFLRVAYPEHFPPGSLLGPFRNKCRLWVGTPKEILSRELTEELHNLTEYANRFHHDTNAAWETEAINDGELRGFVKRALRFARH